MRLLFVTPRYGDFAGGAERAARAFAERCCDGWEVEVATTCAIDHHRWANELPVGVEKIGGIPVHRFAVTTRPPVDGIRVRTGGGYIDGVRALSRSVWSADLHRFLVAEAHRFDLILFLPYLFGTSFWGAQVDPARTVLIPCLHDEPEAYLTPMRALLGRVRGTIFLSRSEARLAARLTPLRSPHVVGVGIDSEPPLPPSAIDAFRVQHGLTRPYVVSVGRIEEGKGVDVLVDLVRRYRAERGELDLVLVGHGPYRPPGWVRTLGYLDDSSRRAAYAGARAFVSASRLESFSLVLLEAWSERTPGICHRACGPMAEHVRLAGAGRTYAGFAGFAAAIDAYADPAVRADAAERGRTYVETAYAWPAVRERFREAIVACAS